MSRGRKPNSANRDYQDNVVRFSACPECGCTDRSSYEQPQLVERQSDHSAALVEVIVLRRCQCLACGTYRVDRCLEVRRRSPAAAKPRHPAKPRSSTPL